MEHLKWSEVKWGWLSRVRLFGTPRTLQSSEFSRPGSWSGWPILLQGVFPTQGSNPGLPCCRRMLHQLSTDLLHSHKICKSKLYQWCISQKTRWMSVKQTNLIILCTVTAQYNGKSMTFRGWIFLPWLNRCISLDKSIPFSELQSAVLEKEDRIPQRLGDYSKN